MAPLTNRERLYQDLYAEAYAYLREGCTGKRANINYAENKFDELLEIPYIPFWMRAQCNTINAAITTEYVHAKLYLKDAEESLIRYEQQRTLAAGHLNDEEKERVAGLRKQLTSISQERIARDAKSANPSLPANQGTESNEGMPLGPEYGPEEEMLLGPEQEMHLVPEWFLAAGGAAPRSAQDLQDDAEMLLGPEQEMHLVPESSLGAGGAAPRSAQDLQDDAEMLLGPEQEMHLVPESSLRASGAALRSAQDLQDDAEMLLGPELGGHGLEQDVQQLALDPRGTTVSPPPSEQTFNSSRVSGAVDTDMTSQASGDSPTLVKKESDDEDEDL